MKKRSITDSEIIQALEKTGGKINAAARLLNADPGNISRRAKRLEYQSDDSGGADWLQPQPEPPQPVRRPERSQPEPEGAPVDPVDISRLKKKIAELEREKKNLLERFERDSEVQSLLRFFQSAQPEPPTWIYEPSKSGLKKRSIPTAFLSDTHFDEIVKPEQVNYVNEYNRAIATERLQRFTQNTIKLSSEYLQGLKYEGLVMPLGGDMFSGNIHDELKQTNEATIFQSLLYWFEQLTAAIKLLADAFGRLFVPVVAGNHGRTTRKPIHKNRNQDNFDWFLGNMLRLFLQDDKRITFNVSESSDLIYPVFGTKYLLTHGDQFRGGSGIAGMLSPLMIGDHRKRKRANAIKLPYDFMIMGHWHTYFDGKGLIVNGSLKGYDEYAFNGNFDYEPPRQAFWVTDERHGKTISCAIHVEDDE